MADKTVVDPIALWNTIRHQIAKEVYCINMTPDVGAASRWDRMQDEDPGLKQQLLYTAGHILTALQKHGLKLETLDMGVTK